MKVQEGRRLGKTESFNRHSIWKNFDDKNRLNTSKQNVHFPLPLLISFSFYLMQMCFPLDFGLVFDNIRKTRNQIEFLISLGQEEKRNQQQQHGHSRRTRYNVDRKPSSYSLQRAIETLNNERTFPCHCKFLFLVLLVGMDYSLIYSEANWATNSSPSPPPRPQSKKTNLFSSRQRLRIFCKALLYAPFPPIPLL